MKDIRFLFLKEDEKDNSLPEVDVTYLWDTKNGIVPNGVSYSKEEENY